MGASTSMCVIGFRMEISGMEIPLKVQIGPTYGSTEAFFQNIRSPIQGTLSNGRGDSKQSFTGQGQNNTLRPWESELKRANNTCKIIEYKLLNLE